MNARCTLVLHRGASGKAGGRYIEDLAWVIGISILTITNSALRILFRLKVLKLNCWFGLFRVLVVFGFHGDMI